MKGLGKSEVRKTTHFTAQAYLPEGATLYSGMYGSDCISFSGSNTDRIREQVREVIRSLTLLLEELDA